MTDASALPAPETTVTSEPHCRNCGDVIAATDSYCPNCGQETRIALPTARQFMREAAGRYVALDGRLWRTMKALMLRPGFLTREYIAGRRRRYVRPGRLFLITSIVAFAAIRLFARAPDFVAFNPDAPAAGSERARIATPGAGKASSNDASTTRGIGAASAGDAKAARNTDSGSGTDDDAVIYRSGDFNLSMDRDLNLRVSGNASRLPVLRDRIEHFNGLPRDAKGEQLRANMLRYGPYAAIALLPAFALMLKLVYAWRSHRHSGCPRRFAAHLVFAAHNHAFLFVLLATVALLPLPRWAAGLIPVAAAIYLLQSMRAVYGGGWVLTLLRAFALFVFYMLLFALVTTTLLIAAALLQ